MKKVRIADVARVAQVSPSTVSQYLNKRYHYMSEETKQRIKTAIEELNYQPNYVARGLRQKKTSTIGVIVANILHTFSTEIIRAIEDYCHLNQFHVIVCNADDKPSKEKEYIEMLIAKQVDGFIVFPTGENLAVYEALIDQGYPIVFMDRLGSNGKGPSVLLDNESASKLAVEHFIDEDIHRIGIVTTTINQHLTPRLERVEGYKKALKYNNLPIREEFIIHTDLKDIQKCVQALLHSLHPPEGLIAGNDLTLLEILKLCKKENISIPDELAIIGIDEVPFASAFQPSLTTIAQPTFEMGNKAAELLFAKMNNDDLSLKNVYRFEPKMNIRASSRKNWKKWGR